MIYIAGPMTGIPDYNYPEFRLAALTLRGLGFEVINPAEEFNGDQDLSRSVYMRQAVGNLLTASALYLLPDWENSPGVCLEVAIAADQGIPV